MRVLITGGLGFIGRVLCDRLAADGCQLTVLARRPGDPRAAALPTGTQVVAADLEDPARTRAALVGRSFDAVCHLAGRTRTRESLTDPAGYYAANVGGTANLLRALPDEAQPSGGWLRFVLASTMSVYGEPPDGQPASETIPARPTSPYGASKLACEQLVGHQAATGRLGAVSLRLFAAAGALGPHGDGDLTRLIPKALAVAAGRFPRMEINGDGSAVREFTHVADVAEAFVLALGAARPGRHEIFNVAGGQAATVREVLAAVEREARRPVPVEFRPAQPEPQALRCDTSRITAQLGWRPSRSSLERIVHDAWAALHA